MESHLEARLWNDIFIAAQSELGVKRGSIKATALIETLVAAFEMDEILYELREHSAGLNIGRWDYIFSCIKKFRANKDFCLADRSQVTMTAPFMRAYALLLVKTCHRRGAPAMGGMAAQIPIKNDPAANAAALEKVRQDKLREVRQGHDGTWVAHPALVPVAREVFDGHVAGAHQIAVRREDVRASAGDLLAVPHGEITEAGLVANIDIGIRYLAAWLGGQGCVPIHNLMEDAATAEISRAQIWQWLRHGARLSDGRAVSERLVRETLARVTQTLPERVGVDPGGGGRFELAARIFEQMATAAEFPDFLTLVAYDYLD